MEKRLDALVLKNVSLGDNISLITVLSGNEGKKLITCHGSKKITGKNMPAVQPFCYCEFICSEKNGRYTLKESFLKESFFDLRCNLDALAIGSYFLEISMECAREDEDESELLSLMLNSLYALTKNEYDPKLIKAVFEIRLSKLLGCAPQLDTCVCCGKAVSHSAFFSPLEGGTVCETCKNTENTRLLPLSPASKEALSYIIHAPEKRIFSFRLSEKALIELAKIGRELTVCTFDKEFESLKFYEEML